MPTTGREDPVGRSTDATTAVRERAEGAALVVEDVGRAEQDDAGRVTVGQLPSMAR
jgi:hypothetical protein